MLAVGSQGLYEWLVPDDDFNRLELCPDIVLGKYVVISSIDSGEFVPTDEEASNGWQSRGGIGYSPKIINAKDVPHGGWDEWYIFDNPTDLGTSHLGDNIFEVPQEKGHVSVFVLWFRLASIASGRSFRSVLAPNNAASPRILCIG